MKRISVAVLRVGSGRKLFQVWSKSSHRVEGKWEASELKGFYVFLFFVFVTGCEGRTWGRKSSFGPFFEKGEVLDCIDFFYLRRKNWVMNSYSMHILLCLC